MSVNVRKLAQGSLAVNLSGATAQPNGSYSADLATWQYAVQYAILQEIKKLNALLACPNFIGIPQTLKRIEQATLPRFKCCGSPVRGNYHKVSCPKRRKK